MIPDQKIEGSEPFSHLREESELAVLWNTKASGTLVSKRSMRSDSWREARREGDLRSSGKDWV